MWIRSRAGAFALASSAASRAESLACARRKPATFSSAAGSAPSSGIRGSAARAADASASAESRGSSSFFDMALPLLVHALVQLAGQVGDATLLLRDVPHGLALLVRQLR